MCHVLMAAVPFRSLRLWLKARRAPAIYAKENDADINRAIGVSSATICVRAKHFIMGAALENSY